MFVSSIKQSHNKWEVEFDPLSELSRSRYCCDVWLAIVRSQCFVHHGYIKYDGRHVRAGQSVTVKDKMLARDAISNKLRRNVVPGVFPAAAPSRK